MVPRSRRSGVGCGVLEVVPETNPPTTGLDVGPGGHGGRPKEGKVDPSPVRRGTGRGDPSVVLPSPVTPVRPGRGRVWSRGPRSPDDENKAFTRAEAKDDGTFGCQRWPPSGPCLGDTCLGLSRRWRTSGGTTDGVRSRRPEGPGRSTRSRCPGSGDRHRPKGSGGDGPRGWKGSWEKESTDRSWGA